MKRSLLETYSPKTLDDVIGNEAIVYQFRKYLESPYPTAFILSGNTGIGKTSIVLALARELGIIVEEKEISGLYSIPSGEQNADTVREVLRSLRLRPMLGSGWKMLIVNEADRMSSAVQYIWLDALEEIPSKTIVMFTTNKPEKIERRLITRFEQFELSARLDDIGASVQTFINRVWLEQTGRTDYPSLDSIPGAIEGSEVSVRAALQGLSSLLRGLTPSVSTVATEAIQATPTVKVANRKYADVDFARLVTLYNAGAKFMEIARMTEIPQATLQAHMEKAGAVFPKRA